MLFEDTGHIAVLLPKDNRALLFSLDLERKKDQIALISHKAFKCHRKCSFAAASGTYIDDQGKLFIYSSPHYLSLKGNKYSIVEFGQKEIPKNATPTK